VTYQNQIENDTIHCFQESIRKGKWNEQPLLLLHESRPPRSQLCPHPFHNGSDFQMLIYSTLMATQPAESSNAGSKPYQLLRAKLPPAKIYFRPENSPGTSALSQGLLSLGSASYYMCPLQFLFAFSGD